MTPQRRFKLSEDWLATIFGLIIVAVIGLGLLGPGGQTVSLTAEAGETKIALLRGLNGWTVSAILAGEKVDINGAMTTTQAGDTYIVTCANSTLNLARQETLPAGISEPPTERAQIAVVNECSQQVSVTYRINPAIPYPIFNLFAR